MAATPLCEALLILEHRLSWQQDVFFVKYSSCFSFTCPMDRSVVLPGEFLGYSGNILSGGLKQLSFYEDPRKPAQFPVTQSWKPSLWMGQSRWSLPPITCPGTRQHLKTTALQDIPAPAMTQSPGSTDHGCSQSHRPRLQEPQVGRRPRGPWL